jgi:dynein heavy chain
MTFSPFKKPFE